MPRIGPALMLNSQIVGAGGVDVVGVHEGAEVGGNPPPHAEALEHGDRGAEAGGRLGPGDARAGAMGDPRAERERQDEALEHATDADLGEDEAVGERVVAVAGDRQRTEAAEDEGHAPVARPGPEHRRGVRGTRAGRRRRGCGDRRPGRRGRGCCDRRRGR